MNKVKFILTLSQSMRTEVNLEINTSIELLIRVILQNSEVGITVPIDHERVKTN